MITINHLQLLNGKFTRYAALLRHKQKLLPLIYNIESITALFVLENNESQSPTQSLQLLVRSPLKIFLI